MSAGRPRRWVLLLPLVLGIIVLMLLIRSRQTPEQAPPGEIPRAMRVMPVPSVTLLPQVEGFGTVEPDTLWEAVAQVSGTVIERHPQLKNGIILPAETVLLRIDPSDYRLALARTETSLQETRAKLAELDIREANIRAALAIEQDALALSEQELSRNRQLTAQGTLPQAELDRQARATLSQRQSVQNQQNALNLLPSERQLLEAQLARFEAQRQQDQLNLERTTVRLPFNARINTVNAQQGEYVRQGEVLLSADSIAVAEVLVRLPLSRLAPLVHGQQRYQDVTQVDSQTLRDAVGLEVSVRLPSDPPVVWEGRFDRISGTLDPGTRTVGVVVAVDEPYQGVQPGVRPPLVRGMFVQVTLRGRPQTDTLMIPRTALHPGSQVYLMDADNRLRSHPITPGFAQGEFITVRGGLEAGETLVVSDPVPAIEGMLLEPHPDEALLERLTASAQGETRP